MASPVATPTIPDPQARGRLSYYSLKKTTGDNISKLKDS